jgi:integrase
MDEYERKLLEDAMELIARVLGREDAKRDFSPILQFVKNEKTDALGASEEEPGFVEFTKKEIQQMPEYFRKMILVNRNRCRMRKRRCGSSYTYEIRYRAKGYNLSASGKTIELAKANMMEKMLSFRENKKNVLGMDIPTRFEAFTNYYYEKFRKEKIREATYRNDYLRLNKYLFPLFGNKELSSITPIECESLIKKVQLEGKGKTADELHSILSIIFKGAIAHGIIERNPLLLVPFQQHERQHGKALTLEEQEQLLKDIRGTRYEPIYALALFTGLRPGELKTARVEGPFIVAVNSKRKSKKVEYKKIPICKRLQAYLDKFNLSDIVFPTEVTLALRFRKFCPAHKLYDLRTTFYSRAKELGVAEHAFKEFVGHSLGRLGESYTDLSDKYLLKEGKKLNKW